MRLQFVDGVSTDLHTHYLDLHQRGEALPDVIWSSAMDLQMALVRLGHARSHRSTHAQALPAWARYKDLAFCTTLEPLVGLRHTQHLGPQERVSTLQELADLMQQRPDLLRQRMACLDIEANGMGFLAMLVARAQDRGYGRFMDLAVGMGLQGHGSNPPLVQALVSESAVLAFPVLGAFAARAVAAGAFVAIAHPQWSGLTLADARTITAAHAVEIYNHGCAMGCDRPDGFAIADLLLTEGRKLTLIATDDAHFSEPDHFGGWVMVKAEANEPEALLSALKAGHFYSSQGPELRDVRIEGGKLIVECSAVSSIVALGWGTGAKAVHGHSMTRGEVPLDRLNNSPWIRAAVIDAAGKRAWSNPIWLGEHGANPRVAG